MEVVIIITNHILRALQCSTRQNLCLSNIMTKISSKIENLWSALSQSGLTAK